MWKHTKSYLCLKITAHKFARISGWIHFWLNYLLKSMTGHVYVYSDCIMNSNAPADLHTHTHCVCQRLGVYFWQGELHASCKWWITSLRTNSEGQTKRKDTVSLCLSFTTIAFILLFYVHKTRGHSFNWLWHNSNIFQTTECKVNKEYF